MPAGRPRKGRFRVRLTAEVLARKGRTCHLCRTDGADSVDHLIPLSMGGTDSLDNLLPAHHACNAARGVMPLAEWFAAHPVPHRPTLPPSRPW